MEWSVGWRPVAARNTQGWWARGGGTQNPEGRAWCLAPVGLRVEGRLRGGGEYGLLHNTNCAEYKIRQISFMDLQLRHKLHS